MISNGQAPTFEPEIAKQLAFFVTKCSRYKIAYGGRGSSKSWGIADSVLFYMIKQKTRILCTRELQATIRDSVHRLLVDRIDAHGIGDSFEVTDHEIRCINGSLCLFKGLRHNIAEIKSMEGIDIVWIEEAQAVSDKSLDYLIPTIRAKDSEIWMSFNTGSVDDPVYKRFVMSPDDDVIVRKINYYDNPWFPEVLRREMERDRKRDPESYKNKWLGEPGTSGRFFVDFGHHMRIEPFVLDNDAVLYGSLDHGTTAATSFGLWWRDCNKKPVRILTYYQSNKTTSQHALGIASLLQSFPLTQGRPPQIVYCDPSMWTKTKHTDSYQPAAIDFYFLVFSEIFKDFSLKGEGYETKFVKANNDIVNGCAVMLEAFSSVDGQPNSYYFDKYNKAYESLIPIQQHDEHDLERYDTKLEDHIADETRYAMVGMMGSNRSSIDKIKKDSYLHVDNLLKTKYSRLLREVAV